MLSDVAVEQELIEAIRRLNMPSKQQLLGYLRSVNPAKPRGMTGKEFVEHVRSIQFAPEDLAEMAAAIEECDLDFLEDRDLE